MPIAPVKIPQNVYIEDRIVGPLTLRQIITVAIGGGISYALWASLSKAYGGLGVVPTVIIWLPCAASVAFAFIKINDLSLMKIILLSLERMNKPSLRVWSPRQGITVNIRTFTTPGDKTKQTEQKKALPLDEISSALDSALEPEKFNRGAADDDREPADENGPSRPVNRERVTADNPAKSDSVDGVEPRASVSIFSK